MNKYLETFMEQFKYEGLTFDDLSLITQYADFLPDATSIETRLTSRITMNIPFISAAMDTVTEAPMAIAMAMLGGIGVIHKNLSPEAQADQVSRVKHHLNGLIHSPVTFREGQTISEILAIRAEKKYTFSGFPILNDHNRVVGVLSSKDIAYAEDIHSKVEDVMTQNLITAPDGTTLEEAYKLMRHHKKGKLPLVDKEGRLTGLYSFTDVHNLVENNQPMIDRDSLYRLRVAAAVSGGNDYERVETRRAYEVRMGEVVSVRSVKIEGTESGVGAASGGVIGGIAGSTAGRGRGSMVGAVLGAVVGGIAGAATEEAVTRENGVEVTVRLDFGRTLAVVQADKGEQFMVGERVRILESGRQIRVTR